MQSLHPEIAPVQALPAYLMTYGAPLLGRAALGGIVLGIIGSVAGLSLGVGTMVARDILEPLLFIKSGKGRLYLLRGCVVGAVLTAMSIALANEGSQILFWNYLSMALRDCGIFIPLTLAIFRPHGLPARWAVASMVLSLDGAMAAGLTGSAVSPVFAGLGISSVIVAMGLWNVRGKGQGTKCLSKVTQGSARQFTIRSGQDYEL